MIVPANTTRLIQHEHHVHVRITHWREGGSRRKREREGEKERGREGGKEREWKREGGRERGREGVEEREREKWIIAALPRLY